MPKESHEMTEPIFTITDHLAGKSRVIDHCKWRIKIYVIEGAKKQIPGGDLDPSEMKDWLVNLDGSEGKEVSKMTVYRIFQPLAN